MFDPESILLYRFVQRNGNRSQSESYAYEHIYCFLVKTEVGCSKYVVKIKEYPGGLLTVNFYRKIKSDRRYKLLSGDFKFGRIGATILDIMKHVQSITGSNVYGIVAATLPTEENDNTNKRYSVYVKIFQRKVDGQRYKVFGTDVNSFIFIIPREEEKRKNRYFYAMKKFSQKRTNGKKLAKASNTSVNTASNVEEYLSSVREYEPEIIEGYKHSF